MKQVLIISHHSLPLDVVSSYRVKAYCDYFYKSELFPTLLTNRWEYNSKSKWINHGKNDRVIKESYPNYNVIRLPNPKIFRISNKFLSKIFTFLFWMQGNVDVELRHSYKVYKRFLHQHLKDHKYDLMIGVFSPHYNLKITYEIYNRFNIPYILDFRDLWGGNRLALKYYSPSIKNFIEDTIIKYHWKKWLSKALFFSITSNPWKEIIRKFSNTEGIVIRNGFEELYNGRELKAEKSLTISYFGAIYSYQNIYPFLKAVKRFIKKNNPQKFKIQFIGIKAKYRNGIINEIEKNLPKKYLEVHASLPKNSLFDLVSKSDLLFYPGSDKIKGWCSVKIYDYLALQKPIIIYPGDNGEIDIIISKTKAGQIFINEEDVLLYLKNCYYQKINGEKIPYFGIKEEILKYRREHQVIKLSEQINRLI